MSFDTTHQNTGLSEGDAETISHLFAIPAKWLLAVSVGRCPSRLRTFPSPRRTASPMGTQRPLKRARRAPSQTFHQLCKTEKSSVVYSPNIAPSSGFRGISSQKGTILPFGSDIPRSKLAPLLRPRCYLSRRSSSIQHRIKIANIDKVCTMCYNKTATQLNTVLH